MRRTFWDVLYLKHSALKDTQWLTKTFLSSVLSNNSFYFLYFLRQSSHWGLAAPTQTASLYMCEWLWAGLPTYPKLRERGHTGVVLLLHQWGRGARARNRKGTEVLVSPHTADLQEVLQGGGQLRTTLWMTKWSMRPDEGTRPAVPSSHSFLPVFTTGCILIPWGQEEPAACWKTNSALQWNSISYLASPHLNLSFLLALPKSHSAANLCSLRSV